jgi:hypothetical protein
LAELGYLRRHKHNPIRIPATRIPGVDQNRLARGCDHQCRCASFDVDPVNVELSIALAGKTVQTSATSEKNKEQLLVHRNFLSKEPVRNNFRNLNVASKLRGMIAMTNRSVVFGAPLS